MTVFTNSVPFSMIPKIFDNFLIDGWVGVFRIGLALLKLIEDDIMQLDMCELSLYLRDMSKPNTMHEAEQTLWSKVTIQKLLYEADKIKLTHSYNQQNTDWYRNIEMLEPTQIDAIDSTQKILDSTEQHVKTDI